MSARGTRPGRRPAPARRRAALVAAPVAIAVGAAATVAWQVADDGPARPAPTTAPTTAAGPGTAAAGTGTPAVPAAAVRAWQESVSADLTPLTGPLIPLLRTIASWREGSGDAGGVRSAIRAALPAFVEVLRAVDAEPDAPGVPQAREHYRDAVLLYVESLRIAYAAAGLPPGPLQQQVQLAHARVRALGDRVFDQGTALLQAALPPGGTDPGAAGLRPAAVPDWASLGLAPGAPLVTPRPAGQGAGAVATARPTQPRADWVAAVRAADVPPAADLAATAHRRDGAAARVLAQRFLAAADRLAAAPDPAGAATAANAVRLGLLTDAEAVLAATAADLAGPAAVARALGHVADVLAVVGSRLWAPALLGPREAGSRVDAVALAADAPL